MAFAVVMLIAAWIALRFEDDSTDLRSQVTNEPFVASTPEARRDQTDLQPAETPEQKGGSLLGPPQDLGSNLETDSGDKRGAQATLFADNPAIAIWARPEELIPSSRKVVFTPESPLPHLKVRFARNATGADQLRAAEGLTYSASVHLDDGAPHPILSCREIDRVVDVSVIPDQRTSESRYFVRSTVMIEILGLKLVKPNNEYFTIRVESEGYETKDARFQMVSSPEIQLGASFYDTLSRNDTLGVSLKAEPELFLGLEEWHGALVDARGNRYELEFELAMGPRSGFIREPRQGLARDLDLFTSIYLLRCTDAAGLPVTDGRIELTFRDTKGRVVVASCPVPKRLRRY